MVFRIFLMLLCLQSSFVFGMGDKEKPLARTGSVNVPSVSVTTRALASQLVQNTGHSFSTLANSATNAASGAVTQFKHTADGAKSMLKDTADEAAKRGEDEARQKEEKRKAQPTKLTIFKLLQNQRIHATWNIHPDLKRILGFDEGQANRFAENFVIALRNDGNSLDQSITVGAVETEKVSVNLSEISKFLIGIITAHNQLGENHRVALLLSQKNEELARAQRELAEKNQQIATSQQSLVSNPKSESPSSSVASSPSSSALSVNDALANQKKQFIKYGVFGGAGILLVA